MRHGPRILKLVCFIAHKAIFGILNIYLQSEVKAFTSLYFSAPSNHRKVVVSPPSRPSAATLGAKRAKQAINLQNVTRRNEKELKEYNAQYCYRRTEDIPYSVTLQALRTYWALNNDLVLPRRYIVPYSPLFPVEFHGVDLSNTVYNMKWWSRHVKSRPERVSELNKLGFVWERLQPEWNLVLEALITYYSMHGNLLVPFNFSVPHGNPEWPRATWGLNLGHIVYRIRSRNDFLRGSQSASRRDQLDRLGFVWDAHERKFFRFHLALRLYAQIMECGPFSKGRTKALRVPTSFKIPCNDEWPSELWGYPLGKKCTAVRQKNLYVRNNPRRMQMLEELGFRWTGNSSLGWLQVVHAAAIFSRIHNRVLDVPSAFVVPGPPENYNLEDEWPWPQHLWGFPLGVRLKDIRLKGAYLHGANGQARRRQLDTLGFVWRPKRGRRKVL